jgi:hypothetical protein
LKNREKTSIFQEILAARALCFRANRKPVALLINKENFDLLIDELKEKNITVSPKELFGIPILVVPQVKDFFLVDNRSWREQKW